MRRGSWPWGGLTSRQVEDIARRAFKLAAWQSSADGHVDTPEGFYESLALAFESLLSVHAERDGANWLCEGYGQPAQTELDAISPTWGVGVVDPDIGTAINSASAQFAGALPA